MAESKIDQKAYTIADFTEIEIGMSYDEILEFMNNPSSSDGFNFKWLIYDLADSSQMKLVFLPSNQLMTMDIIDSSGRVLSLNIAE